MVKLLPVKSLVPTNNADCNITISDDSPSSFKGQPYDRSICVPDDCTKQSGSCNCSMCATTPLVIIPSGDPICSQYNITLRNVQEYVDGGQLKTLYDKSFMVYRQTKCDGSCQIGIFAAIDVEDCEKRVVRPHENVTAKKDVTLLNKPKAVQRRNSYMDPVMLLYRENRDVNAIVQKIVTEELPYETMGGGDELHQIWTVNDPADMSAIQQAFEGVDYLYIADGHHRTAATCKECAKLTNGRALNVAQSSRFLTALIFPDTHLSVLSYNRCVSAWPVGLTQEAFLDKLSGIFNVETVEECDANVSDSSPDAVRRPTLASFISESTFTTDESDTESQGSLDVDLRLSLPGEVRHQRSSSEASRGSLQWDQQSDASSAYLTSSSTSSSLCASPQSRSRSRLRSDTAETAATSTTITSSAAALDQHVLYMYLAAQWYRLTAAPPSLAELACNPLRDLGCQILMDSVLRPILHTDDASSGSHMVYVDGREGSQGVRQQIESGHAVVGFLVRAVPAEHIMKVADAGQLLPAKATFFNPKPAPNLLLRLLR